MMGQTAPARPRGLLARVRAVPVTTALVALDLAAFGAALAFGAGKDEAVLLRLGALERSRVWAGGWWRLLAAPLLHDGWFHLACNVSFTWLACGLLERAAGGRTLLALYVASAVGGSALSLLGHDAISVGASGALFGVLGALLVLHRRALGGWRAFLRSRATHGLASGILLTGLASFFLNIDHLAHAGGLATGAGGAWLLTRPAPRRRWPWAAAGGALLSVVVLACWPRAGLTLDERGALERSLDAALRARDVAGARALLARAEAGGAESERLADGRAWLLLEEGALEPALEAARPLRSARDPAVRDDARRIVRYAAKVLAYRHYTGDGAPRDPWRALGYMDESCQAGDEESCTNAARVRGAGPP